TPFLNVSARPLPTPQDESTEVEALHREMLNLASKIHELVQPEAQFSLGQIMVQVTDPLHQAYLLGSMINLDIEKEQALLEAATRADVFRLMQVYLNHEAEVLELRKQIADRAGTEMSREQREYLLRHQKRAIEAELGEEDAEEAEVVELRR